MLIHRPRVPSPQGRTRIKYLTDGVLLREMLDDPLLTQYRCVLAVSGVD